MATYKDKQSILNEALGNYVGLGFELVEVDDHLAELHYLGKRIAVCNQHKLTIPILREQCQNYLENTWCRN